MNRHNQEFKDWVAALNAEAARRGLPSAYWPMSERDVEKSSVDLVGEYEMGVLAREALDRPMAAAAYNERARQRS